ncbi:MAG: hypothetical protein P1P63_08820 [Treponemataceae bacterium]
MSSSSGWRATAEELYEVITGYGKLIEVEKTDYKRNVMATMKWINEWIHDSTEPHKEFLFLMEKIKSGFFIFSFKLKSIKKY